MDFAHVLPDLVTRFDQEGLKYALIGGLALAMRGVQRATLDADFILLSDDLQQADAILCSMGYSLEFHSENVSHYQSDIPSLGRIDLLHAFRPATLGILGRAERMDLTPACSIPVVHSEDLIGLKVQAACNDPCRSIGDWSDIHRLVKHLGETGQPIDWELVNDYLSLFDQSDRLSELQLIHGTSPSN